MHCKQFEVRLDHLLDQRLSPDTDYELQAHTYECEACRNLLSYHSQVMQHLELKPIPMPSTNFAQRVVTRCTKLIRHHDLTQPRVSLLPAPDDSSNTVKSTRLKLGHWFSWIATTAATTLLIIALHWQFNSADLTNTPVAQQPDQQVEIPVKKPSAITGTNPQQVAEQAFTIENQSSDRKLTQWLKNPNSDVRKQVGSWINDLNDRSNDPLQQFTDGLSPITSSFTVTWKALRQTIPGRRQPSSPQSSLHSIHPTA